MTLASETNKITFNCTGATLYSIPFYFIDDSHLQVYREDIDGVVTTLTITTDYTLTGAGSLSGGSLTTVATYSDGKLTVVRTVPYTQGLDLVQGDGFVPDTLEQLLDKVVMMSQQLERRVDASFRLADSDTSGASTTIPSPEALKFPQWDAAGTALQNAGVDEIATTIQASNFITDTFNDGVDFTAGSSVNLTLSQNPVTENNCQVYFDGVYVEKGDYSISGTTLTFGSAIPGGTSVVEVVMITAVTTSGGTPADNTVSEIKIVDGAVTTDKIANLAVTNNKIANATINEAKVDGTFPVRKVSVSSNDTTPDYLINKVTAGNGIAVAETTDGGDETVTFSTSKAIAQFQHTEANGANSGVTTTNNTWHQRVLDSTVVNLDPKSETWAALATNQITLKAGTYEFRASASTYNMTGGRLKLYNVTDATDIVQGPNVNEPTGSIVEPLVHCSGVFTLAAQKVVELRSFHVNGQADGFGTAISSGAEEVYCDIVIEKIA